MKLEIRIPNKIYIDPNKIYIDGELRGEINSNVPLSVWSDICKNVNNQSQLVEALEEIAGIRIDNFDVMPDCPAIARAALARMEKEE